MAAPDRAEPADGDSRRGMHGRTVEIEDQRVKGTRESRAHRREGAGGPAARSLAPSGPMTYTFGLSPRGPFPKPPSLPAWNPFMPSIQLGRHLVDDDSPAFVIAELGINHQGDLSIAQQLIRTAAECGADAVKFQKRDIGRLLSKEGIDKPYLGENSFGPTYGEHRLALELSAEDYQSLQSLAADLDIAFSASGWDEKSVDFLHDLGIDFFKTASADLTNLGLLAHTAAKGRPLIISTGMATMDEVRAAYEVVSPRAAGLALMQCTSTYPAEFSEIDLPVIGTYRREFPGAVIGYSGHERGIVLPPVAIALGARIIERHLTLDRTMKGSDHAASLEPQGFAKMIRDIRHVEDALGSHEKRFHESERPIRHKLAKSVVAAADLPEGRILTRDDLMAKGPGTGITPARMDTLVGARLRRSVAADTLLCEADLVRAESS